MERRTYNACAETVLTDAGFARLQESWPSHLAAVRRRFLAHVEGFDLLQLAEMFRRAGTAD